MPQGPSPLPETGTATWVGPSSLSDQRRVKVPMYCFMSATLAWTGRGPNEAATKPN
jgi:hypothetical protein